MGDGTISSLSQVKFWILLILSVPSVICSLTIFIYFYQQQRKNVSLHQHLTILLVITSFLQITTDIFFSMLYYQHGKVVPTLDIFCTWWNWWGYSLSGNLLYTMAWGSIERHFLIFHNSLMNTKRKRFIFHFLPASIACLYPALFYLAVIVFSSCKNQWDYDTDLCLLPCYMTDQPAVVTYDFIGNIVFPIAVITVTNVGLILRVLWQKRRHHTTWRRQRKLTLQLLSIAILYILFWFPLTINGLLLTFIPSVASVDLQTNYLFFLIYMVPFLLPFVSLMNLSNIVKAVFRKQQRMVAPAPNII